MLLTNKVVAERLVQTSSSPILRVHDGPKEELFEFVDGFNHDAIKRMNIYRMNRAVYQIGPEEAEHEALGLQYYTHFTSPIRRYIDMQVHRLLFDMEYSVDGDMINYINDRQREIKKCSREDSVLETIFRIYRFNNSVVDTMGVVIEIDEEKIQLYIPEFAVDVDYWIPKLSDVSDIGILNEISVRLVVSMKESNFRKKLLVQLI